MKIWEEDKGREEPLDRRRKRGKNKLKIGEIIEKARTGEGENESGEW